jgi:polysaccharide pyruvyl transferase WcaK-like protein
MRECIERRGISYDNRRIIDEPIHSVSDLLDQLSKTDMVVASRFHNILLSLMQNRPAISISYNIKNDAIMREYGLGEYCQNIESLDVSRLIEQFRELKESASEHVPRLLEKTEEFRIASDAQCEEIFVRLRQP